MSANLLSPLEMAKTLYSALDSKSAQNLKVLEVGPLTVLADYFVLATAGSTTQLKALLGICEEAMKSHEILAHHVEGHHSGSWVLLDFGCVVVHLFLAETRAFYSIEHLWNDARTLGDDELK